MSEFTLQKKKKKRNDLESNFSIILVVIKKKYNFPKKDLWCLTVYAMVQQKEKGIKKRRKEGWGLKSFHGFVKN